MLLAQFEAGKGFEALLIFPGFSGLARLFITGMHYSFSSLSMIPRCIRVSVPGRASLVIQVGWKICLFFGLILFYFFFGGGEREGMAGPGTACHD